MNTSTPGEPEPEPPLLPWHQSAWQRLNLLLTASGAPPDALMLTGSPGTGRHRFARRFAQRLLCEAAIRDDRPCQQCHPCRQLAAGTHPDLAVASPDPEGRHRIDDIRTLQTHIARRPFLGPWRIALLEGAEGLTEAAANALLKHLEEPPPQACWILVVAGPGRLPATVRSRCRRIALPSPSTSQSRDWLAERLGSGAEAALRAAPGAPLTAEALAGSEIASARDTLTDGLDRLRRRTADPTELAAQWKSGPPDRVLDWIHHALLQLARHRLLGGSDEADDPDPLTRPLEPLDLAQIVALAEWIRARRRESRTALNTQLLLEACFIQVLMAFDRQSIAR